MKTQLLAILHMILILLGTYLLLQAKPYFTNSIHNNVIDYKTRFIEPVGYIHFKLETEDAFMANNPIDIEVKTSAVHPEIADIGLTFDGARKYFPMEYNCSPLRDDFQACDNQYRKHLENIKKSYLKLEKTSLTTFGGKIRNITYNTGGEFPLDLTIGYHQDDSIIYGSKSNIQEERFIQVAPPETTLTIQNNNLLIGLSYIMISISILVPTFTSGLHLISTQYSKNNSSRRNKISSRKRRKKNPKTKKA